MASPSTWSLSRCCAGHSAPIHPALPGVVGLGTLKCGQQGLMMCIMASPGLVRGENKREWPRRENNEHADAIKVLCSRQTTTHTRRSLSPI